MTKYSSLSRKRAAQAGHSGPHPIWNGIGCLIILIIPVISFGLGVMTLDYGLENGWPIPGSMLGYVSAPAIMYRSNVLIPIAEWISNIQNLTGYLVVTFIYVVVLGGIMSFAYALAYRFIGPPPLGPMDAPPPRNTRVKRYKR